MLKITYIGKIFKIVLKKKFLVSTRETFSVDNIKLLGRPKSLVAG